MYEGPGIPVSNNRRQAMPTRLEVERRSRGWSQSDLARFVGLTSPGAASRWENLNRRPSTAVAQRLEALLGLRLDELLAPENANGAAPEDDSATIAVLPAREGIGHDEF